MNGSEDTNKYQDIQFKDNLRNTQIQNLKLLRTIPNNRQVVIGFNAL